MAEIHGLLERLAALERYNARLGRENGVLKALGGVTLAVVVALLLLGHERPTRADEKKPAQKKERIVEAEKFLLRDANNRIRAAIHLGKNGPKYDLYDEKGSLRAALGLDKSGDPVLLFLGANGKPQVTLVSGGSNRALALHGSKGEVRAMLGCEGDDSFLMFGEGKGKQRVQLVSSAKVRGLILKDDREKPRLSLTLEKDRPRLKMLDPADKVLFEKP